MAARKITWTKRATRQFSDAIQYIRQDSQQNAEKVKKGLLQKINQLSDDTIVHRKDPLKKDNDGSFLYFELSKYRIAYQERPDDVLIVQIIHTSMEPKLY